MNYTISSNELENVHVNKTSIIVDVELSRFSRELLTFAAVVTVIIMVAGVIGNLLTILALIKCPKIRNVASTFIMSLCVADFIFCLFVLPFSSSRFIHGGWIHGPLLCTLFPFLRYGNIGVSLLSIAMITINRYVMIAHYSSYNRIYKTKYIAVMIVLCWSLSYGMILPTLFGIWGKFGKDMKLGTCSIIPDENGRSAKTPLFIIAFLIPCIAICCCYARIFWVVRSSELRIRKHAVDQYCVANNEGNQQLNKKKEEIKLLKVRRNEWRITQMVLVIFLSYLFCYLPITIVKVTDKDVKYPGIINL
ncbi:class A rhodopsin-like G-protein coupled receptor GPRmtn, putative [Pediculus humanus corporis]|uniref:Class A rhodopsin-like G-protein coupled receptor GPRmtn, putative n=1 Tax=Pediculus humanus subsp. corporis TaxID=121224 RepID=E0VLI2_PEDHC|nr:class A rhodopsin-like G-protein coupled receptor GPRmtn, putative [Pediculus humanus corporis]EEB14238.1 class A rhodopsin-like G-protein coupled receptor GPRmtn, putative [Pediculus humanus corporis]